MKLNKDLFYPIIIAVIVMVTIVTAVVQFNKLSSQVEYNTERIDRQQEPCSSDDVRRPELSHACRED